MTTAPVPFLTGLTDGWGGGGVPYLTLAGAGEGIPTQLWLEGGNSLYQSWPGGVLSDQSFLSSPSCLVLFGGPSSHLILQSWIDSPSLPINRISMLQSQYRKVKDKSWACWDILENEGKYTKEDSSQKNKHKDHIAKCGFDTRVVGTSCWSLFGFILVSECFIH